MKKNLLLSILIVLSSNVLADGIDWSLLRIDDKATIQSLIQQKRMEKSAFSHAELGLLYHTLAVQNEADASVKAVQLLTQYLDGQPPKPMLLALRGSAKSMMARDAEDLGDKMAFANQGIADLNEAIMLAPDNAQIRHIRIRVFAKLPAMFKKKSVVLSDIDYLFDHHLIKDESTHRQLIQLRSALR